MLLQSRSSFGPLLALSDVCNAFFFVLAAVTATSQTDAKQFDPSELKIEEEQLF